MDLQLDTVIEVLLSPDNQRRAEAEKFVENIPTTHFEQGIDAFLMTMHHESPQVSTMAALLLKKKYMENEENAKKLSVQKLEYIVKSVQGCMQPEKTILFLRRCCDILVKAYNLVGQQKQLIKLIQGLACHEHLNMKITLFYLMEMICECSFDDALHIENASVLEAMFQKGLEDDNNEVKVAAFKTLTIFLSSIKDEKVVKKFESVLQLLINKAVELIKYDQESGVTALESLNELIETHPKFIKSTLPQLIGIYTEVMEAAALLLKLRSTAMYGILIMCMNHPVQVRKLDYFRVKMVPVYMQILSEIGSTTEEEWAAELNDEIVSKNDVSLSAEEHLSQITMYLTNKFMLPLFIPYIQQFLASSQINHQHAGLIAMAMLTEDCDESFKKELSNVMGLIGPLLGTNNARIIHDILVAIGYMSEEFAPQIQTKYGENILQFIKSALQYPALKVQFKAIQCLTNFEKGLAEHKEVRVIDPFLPTIIQEICRIFEFSIGKQNYLLLDQVLDVVATIAEMNPFEQYYPIFMPGLKKILGLIGSHDQQEIMARSKTIETMGFLLASVKEHPHIFEPDCKQIMGTLIQMSMNIPKDDPLHKAMFIVYQNVVTSMKGNFLLYSDHVFERMVEAASRKVELTIIDEGESSKVEDLKGKKHNYAAYKLDMKIDGVKNLVLNTDHLAQKIEATNLMVQMAEDMGTSYAKYIEATIPVVVELISLKHNKTIRLNMIETIKYMLRACSTNEQRTLILQATFLKVCEELAICIRQKDHGEISSLAQLMAESMPYMTHEMVARLPEMLTAVLSLVKSESSEIESEYADKEMDQALQEQMGDEIDEIEECLEHIESIIRTAQGMQSFEQLKKLFPKEYEWTPSC